jgi:hypothetical protein
MSPAAVKVLREAQALQKTMHDSYIAQDHLLLALIKDPNIAAVLKEASLNEKAVKTAIEQTRGNRRVDSKNAEQGFDALNKCVFRNNPNMLLADVFNLTDMPSILHDLPKKGNLIPLSDETTRFAASSESFVAEPRTTLY